MIPLYPFFCFPFLEFKKKRSWRVINIWSSLELYNSLLYQLHVDLFFSYCILNYCLNFIDLLYCSGFLVLVFVSHGFRNLFLLDPPIYWSIYIYFSKYFLIMFWILAELIVISLFSLLTALISAFSPNLLQLVIFFILSKKQIFSSWYFVCLSQI